MSRDKVYFRALAADFRALARASQRLGWRSEMFDHLRAAAYCVVCAVRS